MIGFPFKRVFGLIGAMRTGKDSVANFLTETRGFGQIAFADQIKEEFGISKADFEAAKIAGNIEELRNKLWAFSAEKKKADPEYFIKKVLEKAINMKESVIITDIRTIEEFNAFLAITGNTPSRMYWIKGQLENEIDNNGCLAGSKLSEKMIVDYMFSEDEKYDIRCIFNNENGLFRFYQYLEKFFFVEDIKDIWERHKSSNTEVPCYVNQFEVRQKGS